MPPPNSTVCNYHPLDVTLGLKKIKIRFSQGSTSLIHSVVKTLLEEDRGAVRVMLKHLPKESIILVKHKCVFEKQLTVKEVGIFAAVVVCKKVEN